MNRDDWPELKRKLATVVRTRTRDEWEAIMGGSDVCFAPVLGIDEAPSHPHNAARQTFVTVEGVVQPAPAPRFSASPAGPPAPPPAIGAHNHAALADWGFDDEAIRALESASAL